MSGYSSYEEFQIDTLLRYKDNESEGYSLNYLRNNSAFVSFGLGALLRLLPPIPSSTVVPLVAPNTDISTYEISDKNIRFDGFIYSTTKYDIILNLINKNGVKISRAAAIKQYEKDKKHFGIFNLGKKIGKTSTSEAVSYLFYLNQVEFSRSKKYEVANDSTNFGPYVTNLEISYSMQGSNQLVFTVIDKDYKFMEANYFQARREIAYRGEIYEISSVEVGPGPANSPQVVVTALTSEVQKMKRDKKPENIAGSSLYEYAASIARKYDLKLVAEKSNKTQTLNKGTGNNVDENVWSILRSNAESNEYLCFIVDKTLFLCSPKWLIWKFGTETKTTESLGSDKKTKITTVKKYNKLFYSPETDYSKGYVGQNGKFLGPEGEFLVIEYPSIRQSENDPLEGDGNVKVKKPSGCIIRPGQTVYLGPKPSLFKGGYLVSEVSFSEGTNEPVSISFLTPAKPKKQENQPQA